MFASSCVASVTGCAGFEMKYKDPKDAVEKNVVFVCTSPQEAKEWYARHGQPCSCLFVIALRPQGDRPVASHRNGEEDDARTFLHEMGAVVLISSGA